MARPAPRYVSREKDTYWRLQLLEPGGPFYGERERLRGDLQRAGYKVKAHHLYRDLAKLWLHHTLEQACYDSCTDDEVRTFAIDRGLAPANAKLSRRTLIKRLRDKDMSPSFSRFIDLPPEIRTIVYELYMSDFTGKSLSCPTSTPITRVSRMLRSESLPLFYRTATFMFSFQTGVDGAAVIDSRHGIFLDALAKANLGFVRKMDMRVSTWRGRYYRIRITMNSAGSSFAISVKSVHHSDAYTTERAHATSQGLAKIFKDVTSREGQAKLTREDIPEIMNVFSLLR